MDWDQLQKLTGEKFKDPQTGDWFHEMCNHYIHVIKRTGDKVIATDEDGVEKEYTLEAFAKAHEYKTIPGQYWVVYGGRK